MAGISGIALALYVIHHCERVYFPPADRGDLEEGGARRNNHGAAGGAEEKKGQGQQQGGSKSKPGRARSVSTSSARSLRAKFERGEQEMHTPTAGSKIRSTMADGCPSERDGDRDRDGDGDREEDRDRDRDTDRDRTNRVPNRDRTFSASSYTSSVSSSTSISSKDGPLGRAVRRGNLTMVARLLRAGADIEQTDKVQHTPMHLAAFFGRNDILRILTQHGGDVDARNRDKNTPLHQAAFTGGVDAINILIQAGAHVSAQNESGETPMHVAAYVEERRGGGERESEREKRRKVWRVW